MDIVNFEGKTRTLGVEQGFRALHIKDIVAHMGLDENGKSIVYAAMISVWKPTEQELEMLNKGGYITLTILGTQHPPVMIETIRNE